MPHTAEKLSESVWFRIVARGSMILALPMITLLAVLFNANLEQKFAAQSAAAENQSRVMVARIETVERGAAARIETAEKTASIAVAQSAAVNDRLISVETKQAQESASNERFQAATLQRLDRVQDSLVGLSNAVSALTATLQTVIENNRNKQRP